MSDRIDKLCDDLKSRLNAVDASVQRAKASLAATPGKVEQAVQANLEQAKARVEERKTQIRDSQAHAKSKLQQDLAGAKGKFQTWKANREAKKLARHADDAEEYAAFAFFDAAAAVDEAEVAAPQAILARLAADATEMAVPAQ